MRHGLIKLSGGNMTKIYFMEKNFEQKKEKETEWEDEEEREEKERGRGQVKGGEPRI